MTKDKLKTYLFIAGVMVYLIISGLLGTADMMNGCI
jgi:hypothetical protein